MKTFRFSDFTVYIKSKLLYGKILQLTEGIRDFSLKDQSRRVGLSIVLNIAEGSAKRSDKEFSRFLQISLGSVNELYACLDIMQENSLINEKEFRELTQECQEVARQLGGFSKKLRAAVNS